MGWNNFELSNHRLRSCTLIIVKIPFYFTNQQKCTAIYKKLNWSSDLQTHPSYLHLFEPFMKVVYSNSDFTSMFLRSRFSMTILLINECEVQDLSAALKQT